MISLSGFQREVFSLLFGLKEELQQLAAIFDPGKSSFTRLESESDLKSFEESMKVDQKKWICVSLKCDEDFVYLSTYT